MFEIKVVGATTFTRMTFSRTAASKTILKSVKLSRKVHLNRDILFWKVSFLKMSWHQAGANVIQNREALLKGKAQ
jgi:hypothetical protein